MNMKPDILEYLRLRGCTLIRDGGRYVTNSPIKALSGGNDRTPSFVVWSDGGWKDFSTGEYGDIYKLKHILNDPIDLTTLGTFQPGQGKKQSHWEGSIPPKYLDISSGERDEIMRYAASRRITRGFTPAVYFTPEYERRLALMFVHVDLDGEICGAKFRAAQGTHGRRFVMRGKPGFYILRTTGIFMRPKLFLIESETSANSLWEYAQEKKWTAIIISMGGVENIPKKIPFSETKYKRLLLDYDGDDELYQRRIAKYSHLGIQPLKLVLPKGEDINSLYCRNELKL
jgi:hypothetical protein